MEKDQLLVTPKRPKGEDGYRTFSIRIREDLVGRIEEIARETGRSRNELIGMFLEDAVRRCKVEKT